VSTEPIGCTLIKMRFTSLLGLLAVTPVLVAAFTVSDVTSKAASRYAKRDTVSDILTDIEDAAECTACEVGISPSQLVLCYQKMS